MISCLYFIDVGAQKFSERRGEGKTQAEDAKGEEETYHKENKSLMILGSSVGC